MKKQFASNSYHFRNLSIQGWKSYKLPLNFHIKDINFVIGPNNSGKSNLLKIMLFAKNLITISSKYKRSIFNETDLNINVDDIFNKYSKNNSITISLETQLDWLSKKSMVNIEIIRIPKTMSIQITKISIVNGDEILYEISHDCQFKINVTMLLDTISRSFIFHNQANEFRTIQEAYEKSKNQFSEYGQLDEIYGKIILYNKTYNENIDTSDLEYLSDYSIDMILSTGIGFSTIKSWSGVNLIHLDATKYIKSKNDLINRNNKRTKKFEYLYFNSDKIYLLFDTDNIKGNKVNAQNELVTIFNNLSSSKNRYTEPTIPSEVINIARDQILAALYIPIDSISHFSYIGNKPDSYILSNDIMYNLKIMLNSSKTSAFRTFLYKNLPQMEIGDKLRIFKIHETYEIQVMRLGAWIPERLLGSGARKMLFLMMDIVYNGAIRLNEDFLKSIKEQGVPLDTISRHKILLEEPEANLHPRLQSKLAELIVEANREFKIQFIVETHSEYMIRKLQYLVANGDCESKDIQIFYLNFDPDRKTTVKQDIQITEKGTLSKPFGQGFFDEADKLTLDLFLLSGSADN